MMDIYGLDRRGEESTCVFLVDDGSDLSGIGLRDGELAFLKRSRDKEQRLIFINRLNYWFGFSYPDPGKKDSALVESFRIDGTEIHQWAVSNKITALQLENLSDNPARIVEVSEGIALKNYQFLKYFSDQSKKKHSLSELGLVGAGDKLVNELSVVVKAVCLTRDLINEPLSTLTAPRLTDEIKILGDPKAKPLGFQPAGQPDTTS